MKKIAKIEIDQLRINLPILSTRKHIKTKRNKMWDEFDFTINDIDQLLSLKKFFLNLPKEIQVKMVIINLLCMAQLRKGDSFQ